MATRTARINGARALLREFGVACPTGADRFLGELPALLEEKQSLLSPRLRATLLALWEEVRDLECRTDTVEAELAHFARQIPVLKTLPEIPGVGILTATALWAAVGNVHSYTVRAADTWRVGWG